MLRFPCGLAFVFCFAVASGPIWSAPEAKSVTPQSVDGFRLNDADGKTIEVAVGSKPQFTVVCFLGAECPLARLYAPRLNQLAETFKNRGVRFVGVDSNVQDSQDDVSAFAREYKIAFPLLKDPDNRVADQFQAQRVSEVFVLDQTLTIRYHGRIDDQYQPGVMRSQATRDDLRIALDELVAGKPVSTPRTNPAGCAIGRIKATATKTEVTYCKQVARVLNQHCVECHRPGEIGPFSLTDYNEIRGWGDTLLESIDAGRMPPWNANPEHGHFRNTRRMPDADKQLLRDWVNAGMPYGDQADLPPAQEFASGWQLPRPPDLVVKMRERPFHVPAAGTIEYQYFVVDPQFTEDRWISAAQVIPGSRPTVHHCIVFVRPPDGADVRGVGYLTGYVPGQRSFSLPPGHARKVPAGSKLVFQM
ncbi:MAG TPA: redoxin domain-containing protein, partial [Planctomycetaceae bacterium]|nr:redoxin domain-containing protein [Planctomycetaceae bacterium]